MRKAIFALVVLFIAAYGIFEARRLIEGPSIIIETPQNGTATSSAAVIVSGTARNISFLTINDAPAFTDEDGYFREVLTPPKGYTVITVAAVDRFGRRDSKEVTISTLNYCTEQHGTT